jgi:hypothetical protein
LPDEGDGTLEEVAPGLVFKWRTEKSRKKRIKRNSRKIKNFKKILVCLVTDIEVEI